MKYNKKIITTCVLTALMAGSGNAGVTTTVAALFNNYPIAMHDHAYVTSEMSLVSSSFLEPLGSMRTVTIIDESDCARKLIFHPAHLELEINGESMPFTTRTSQADSPLYCEHIVAVRGEGVDPSFALMGVIPEPVVTLAELYNVGDISVSDLNSPNKPDPIEQGSQIIVRFTPPEDWRRVPGTQTYYISSYSGPTSTEGSNKCIFRENSNRYCEITVNVLAKTNAGYGYLMVNKELGTKIKLSASNLSYTVSGQKWKEVVESSNYSCGISEGREAYCWGDNEFGQLGSGSAGGVSLLPVAVASDIYSPYAVTSLVLGDAHSCLLTNIGKVYCWGSNSVGQLGDGNWDNYSATPLLVDLGEHNSQAIKSITATSYATCVSFVESSQDEYCWGL